jgi:predicted MFS family arabinose efflux permease
LKPTATSTPFTPYQKFVVFILAFLQFTIILDFMILSPLGAVLIPTLGITPSQFGLVVSGYAFSAGIAGILAAGFADRFDRKKLLLFFYAGFVLGTFLCGIAKTYDFLLYARMVTGLFGGVIGSITFAITTDLFPYEMRGRVMGIIQTAFAGSQVLGIPIGLYLSNRFNWNAPFLMIVGISILVGIVMVVKLKPIDGHLKLKQERNPLKHLWKTISVPRYLQGFATTALLGVGGFMIMPFSSAFTVHNMGISLERLPLIYMVTGIFSIVTGPMVGRLSDAFGKFRVFFFGCVTTIIMVLIYTHLQTTPIGIAILVSILMFAAIMSRMIPASALMSALPKPADRGAYMSVSSSIQQISGGIAAALAGMIVVQSESGHIEHFDTIGYIMSGTTLLTLFLVFLIHKSLGEEPVAPIHHVSDPL